MKPLYASVLAVLVTLTIVGILTIGIQPARATTVDEQIKDFKKLTNEFENDILKLISDPDVLPQPHLVQEFKEITREFQNDIISAVLDDELSRIGEIVSDFKLRVMTGIEDEAGSHPSGSVPVIFDYTQRVLNLFCERCD